MAEQIGQAYAQMINRKPILDATINALELDMDWRGLSSQVFGWQVPRSQILQISVKDTSPERAVAIADELALQLILQSPTSPENKTRQDRGQFVQGQLDDLEQKIQNVRGPDPGT